jgi:hypothetical protein
MTNVAYVAPMNLLSVLLTFINKPKSCYWGPESVLGERNIKECVFPIYTLGVVSVYGEVVKAGFMYIILFVVCFLGGAAHCGCIFHSPVAGFSLLVFEVS